MSPMIRVGLDQLETSEAVWSRCHDWGRVALVTHAASVASSGRTAVDVADDMLWQHGRGNLGLTAVLGPQHGYWQCEPYNMVETPDGEIELGATRGGKRGSRRRIPLFSLYGPNREPTPDHLKQIDTLLVDLPDIGCRIYTYMTTLAGCLRAAARAGKRVVVLDRPNPLGLVARAKGTTLASQQAFFGVEGNVLDMNLRSFVGWFQIPMRHGLTLGELGRWFVKQEGLGGSLAFPLEIIGVEGVSRLAPPGDLAPFLPRMASPNMPGPWTMDFFPVAVPLEGCNVSEGRGTTSPFQSIGAPFFDENDLCDALAEAAAQLGCADDVTFRPHRFVPSFDKFAGQLCRGVFLQARHRSHDTSRHNSAQGVSSTSFAWAIALLAALCRSGSRHFSWRAPGYEYNFEDAPIDLILGDRRWRLALDALKGSSSASAWEDLVALLAESRVSAQLFAERSESVWIY